MTAPVIGFTAEVPNGLLDRESYVQIAPDMDAATKGGAIEVTISWPYAPLLTERSMTVSHDEARQIIAGLASVIT